MALEDPEILDETTLIGTSTLRDWVMGGYLASRLWVQDRGDVIEFQRPLRNDDLLTSDRRYLLSESDGESSRNKMSLARNELKRLRYLAALEHPFDLKAAISYEETDPVSDTAQRVMEARARLRQNRGKRKFFGL